MDHRRQIAILLAWCTLNDFDIDSRLKLQWDTKTGIGVYSKGSNIPPHTTLVRIPRHAVLSTKSCTLSEYIPYSPYGLGAQLALSLALYVEVLRGNFSRWFGYLQSLHHNVGDIPVFWHLGLGTGESDHRRLVDGNEALGWLRGTEAERILQKRLENNKDLIGELDDYYHGVAEPLLLRHRGEAPSQPTAMPTLHGFYRAYSLVTSRAFVLDAYHGLCMVPIADAFNHELQNHVHLESDYHVCPECGSLHECPHDRDDSLAVTAVNSSVRALRTVANEEKEKDYHMVSVTRIPPRVEVFNTYGGTLTNSQLLTQYGFILEANDNDILTWHMEQVLQSISSGLDTPSITSDAETILYSWEALWRLDWTLLSRSGLIYLTGADAGQAPSFALDGDGKVSHHLWLIVSLIVLKRSPDECNETSVPLSRLRSLLDAQFILESHLEMEDETEGQDAGRIDDYRFGTTLLKELEQLCQLMIRLCADRKARTGLVGSLSKVGEYFDVLPVDKPRTRMAISLVLNELSLLNSCQATWRDLLCITRRVDCRV